MANLLPLPHLLPHPIDLTLPLEISQQDDNKKKILPEWLPQEEEKLAISWLHIDGQVPTQQPSISGLSTTQ